VTPDEAIRVATKLMVVRCQSVGLHRIFAIMTTKQNAEMDEIHNRMPVSRACLAVERESRHQRPPLVRAWRLWDPFDPTNGRSLELLTVP
jgi:hypothetical protein